MRCQKCSAENPQGAKFCIQCATPFKRRCEKCDFKNPPEARFCAQCAAPLDAAAPIRTETKPYDGLSGEQRHLTVLFCDLIGSTEIAGHLDPEQWREIVGEYHRAAQAIERFGGRVAQYFGDGVMAYFGYPEALDNDAERAARGSLAILDAISKLNEQPGPCMDSLRYCDGFLSLCLVRTVAEGESQKKLMARRVLPKTLAFVVLGRDRRTVHWKRAL